MDAAPGSVERGKRMIHIEGTWYVDADEAQYMLVEQYERKNSPEQVKKTGQEMGTYRSVYGYYSTIYAAVKGYRDMVVRNMVRGGDYELAALISKIRGVDERLKDTLETCIKA